MVELKYLSLSGNKINEVGALSQLLKLERLYIHDNQIENIISIKSLLALNYVSLEGNCISDFSPIEYLKENGKLTTATGDSAEEQVYARCE